MEWPSEFVMEYSRKYNERVDALRKAMEQAPNPKDVIQNPEIYREWWNKHWKPLFLS